ncbi:MAG TPA: hypothetical protein VKH36_08070 [Acidimicrobiia bacterium]|nr:hypothetical protein [Acidimicrobiia bacterium]
MPRHPALRAALLAAIITAIAVGLPLARPYRASAADNGLWSVFPTTAPTEPGQLARPFFQPLLTPGVPVQDSVTITNKTPDQTINFDLYAADAFNTREGGYASRRPTDPKREMGAWISLAVDNITIPPQRAVDVPFTISPPLDATPGDHAGSIVALNTTPTVSQNGSVATRSIQAVGTRVYGRVAGPLTPRLDVTELQVTSHAGVGGLLGGAVDADVTYRVVNTGNVRLSPTAKTTVSPMIGGATHLKTLRVPELLPRGSAVVHQRVSGVVPVGRLTAHVTVTSPVAKTTASSSTWVVPWLLIVIIALLVLVLWYWRRRRRRKVGAAPPPEREAVLAQ